MLKVYAGLAVAGVAALLGGSAWYVYSSQASDPFAQCRTSVVSGGAGAIGGPFTLVDQTGRERRAEEVIDKPSLVYFGYTFCPDVCPMDNARNAEAVDILEEQGIEVTPIFISIDPERDTPEVMAEYVEMMHPKMIGLTGSAEQVKVAAQAYRTYFKAQEKTDDYYLVDHSTFTYLMDPKHGFMDFFKRETSPEEMAKQVTCFVERS